MFLRLPTSHELFHIKQYETWPKYLHQQGDVMQGNLDSKQGKAKGQNHQMNAQKWEKSV